MYTYSLLNALKWWIIFPPTIHKLQELYFYFTVSLSCFINSRNSDLTLPQTALPCIFIKSFKTKYLSPILHRFIRTCPPRFPPNVYPLSAPCVSQLYSETRNAHIRISSKSKDLHHSAFLNIFVNFSSPINVLHVRSVHAYFPIWINLQENWVEEIMDKSCYLFSKTYQQSIGSEHPEQRTPKTIYKLNLLFSITSVMIDVLKYSLLWIQTPTWEF